VDDQVNGKLVCLRITKDHDKIVTGWFRGVQVRRMCQIEGLSVELFLDGSPRNSDLSEFEFGAE
jgi:hypothetical protein